MSTEAKNEKQGLGVFLSEVRVELKKVRWLERKELLSHTVTVIVTVTVVSGLIYLIDAGLSVVVGKFLG